MKILLIPDAFVGTASGAVVAQVLTRLMTEQGHQVAVFSDDVENKLEDNICFYKADKAPAKANYFQSPFKKKFISVLDQFNPNNVFFVGSITNKPLIYLEIALQRHLHTDVFIFMQDFFCSKFYANDNWGPCTKCLDQSLSHVFFSSCGVSEQLSKLQLLVRWDIRRRLKKILPKMSHVITSTDEQCDFYKRFGIHKENIYKMPLPFGSNKINRLIPTRGTYFIGIAQNRIEKGYHLIPNILDYLPKGITVILAYYNSEAVSLAINKYGLQKYIDSGKLQVIAKTWNDGLGELISGSLGVINPTIWPTTTEYGFIETLALSKPILAFDISAHHEFISHRVNGFLAPLGDFKAFASNMELLSNMSDDEYNLLCSNVKKLYNEQWNDEHWKKCLQEILN